MLVLIQESKGLGFYTKYVYGLHQSLQRFRKDYYNIEKIKISDRDFPKRYSSIIIPSHHLNYPIDKIVEKHRSENTSLPYPGFFREEKKYATPTLDSNLRFGI